MVDDNIIGKLIHGKVTRVTEIKALGARVRLTFNSVKNPNACLSDNQFKSNGFTASIPSTLIYSLGVIQLYQSISESDFFDGLDPDHRALLLFLALSHIKPTIACVHSI